MRVYVFLLAILSMAAVISGEGVSCKPGLVSLLEGGCNKPGKCASGQYTVAGSDFLNPTCRKCPGTSVCTSQTQCPAGQYTKEARDNGKNQCEPCPDGFFKTTALASSDCAVRPDLNTKKHGQFLTSIDQQMAN